MPLTNYAFDNFVAPKLSELKRCGVEALPEPCNFLSSFILSTVFMCRYPDDQRAMLFNFIRRVEQAFYEYEQGTINLRAHVGEPRTDHIALYFRALAHFEQCLAVLYQAAMFFKVTKPDKKMFHTGDGSVLDRVNKIYNVSHHMYGQIVDGNVPPSATTLGSCPRAWCRSGGGVAISGEVGRKRQAVTADSLTIGSSLKGAMVSRDI